MEYADYLTVKEINEKIRSLVTKETSFYNIVVVGEISGFKISGPHAYFTLKDSEAQLRCSFFRFGGNYIPKDGDKVLAKGSIDYYAKGGYLSFNCSLMAPFGIGEMYRKLEELKKKLEDEGIFDASHKKKIPIVCKTVAVVTSRTGAVIRDICKTVRQKNRFIDIKLINTRVQGDGAEKDITEALKLADTISADVIVLARGGGSFEDLLPFNTEAVARTLYSLTTPVISAVGHETDFTLSDFASDFRCATPTAAAEKVAFDEEECKESIIAMLERIAVFATKNYENYKKTIERNVLELSHNLNKNCLRTQNKVNISLTQIANSLDGIYQSYLYKVRNAMTSVSAKNPMTILQKGYAKAEKEGKPIVSVKQLESEDSISLTFVDGTVRATLTDIIPKD